MNEDTRSNQGSANSAARDRAQGSAAEAKGRLKESWGVLTDDQRMQAEGRSDQLTGATRRKKGQWKERFKAWIDRM